MKKVSGRLSLAMSSMAFSPSPVVTPGSGSAEIVAEFSWLNCSIAAGEALVEIFTTADSGTISPVDAAHEILAELFGIVAELLRHLRDDVVAVGVAVELRHFGAADQQRQRPADIGDRQVEGRGAVAVDGHRHLRRVEGHRVLHDDEAAGGLRLVLDLLGHLEHLARRRRSSAPPWRSAGRRRSPAASAARRRRPRRRPPWRGGPGCLPGSPCELRVRSAQSLKAKPTKAPLVCAAEGDGRELRPRFRDVLDQAEDLVDVGLGVVRRRIARRGDDRQQEALVFLRRQFARGLGEHEAGHARPAQCTIISVTGR